MNILLFCLGISINAKKKHFVFTQLFSGDNATFSGIFQTFKLNNICCSDGGDWWRHDYRSHHAECWNHDHGGRSVSQRLEKTTLENCSAATVQNDYVLTTEATLQNADVTTTTMITANLPHEELTALKITSSWRKEPTINYHGSSCSSSNEHCRDKLRCSSPAP